MRAHDSYPKGVKPCHMKRFPYSTLQQDDPVLHQYSKTGKHTFTMNMDSPWDLVIIFVMLVHHRKLE